MLLSSTEMTTASLQPHVHVLALALLQCPADCPEQNGTYIGTLCSLQWDTTCHRVPARTQNPLDRKKQVWPTYTSLRTRYLGAVRARNSVHLHSGVPMALEKPLCNGLLRKE